LLLPVFVFFVFSYNCIRDFCFASALLGSVTSSSFISLWEAAAHTQKENTPGKKERPVIWLLFVKIPKILKRAYLNLYI
jgi:hypothetical protein